MRMVRNSFACALVLASISVSAGCATRVPAVAAPSNPSFPVTIDQADFGLSLLREQPKQLERPLVIVGGFMDIGVGPYRYEKSIRPFVKGKIIRIAVADLYSFNLFRQRLVSRIDEALGVVDPNETVEVDVIGQSMGGLIALYAAIDDPALGKRVRIKRLFTISSPLTGAKLALLTPFNVFAFQGDMRPGSMLYQRIATTKFDFPIYSYTRLDDGTVGEVFAGLPGIGVWWVDNTPGERAHIAVFRDHRVLLDIVRRLRGEAPITRTPPAPLPATQPALP